MDEQKKKLPCRTCKADLLPESIFCKECNSWQTTAPCVVCGQSLPPGAKRCNGCSTYQKGWLKRIPFSQNVLTLLVALVAVISPAVTATLYLLDRPSSTSFKVSGADDKHLYLKVWNTGRLPSTLVGYHLALAGQPPIPDVDLDLTDKDRRDGKNIIASKTPVTIAMVATDPNWLPKPLHPEGYTSGEFKQYEEKMVTLVIDVEESCGLSHRSDRFPVKRIRGFLCGECGNAK